jgi:hypothetical protein
VSILPQPDYPTGTVVLKEAPVTSPWPIISDEAQAAWQSAQAVLAAGYPDDHADAVAWYVASWERVNDKPAQDWVRAVAFSPDCLAGACWDCEWDLRTCGCGHHAPWSCAPAGPVIAADPLPAVAEFLGIAKPVAEPERDPEEDAPAGRAVADDEEPVAEPTPEAATAVIAVTDAPTEAVPVVKEGESDE